MAPYINALLGCSQGYRLSLFNKQEAAVRQGRNYYLTAANQVVQLIMVVELSNSISNNLPKGLAKTAAKVACFVATWAGVVFLNFFGLVKQGDINFSFLGKNTIIICHFMAEHSGDILKVAGFINGIAIAVLVNPYYGMGILLSLTYEAADSRGLINRKVSLFVEKYFEPMASVGSFINSGALNRGLILMGWASKYMPACNESLQWTVDNIMKKYFRSPGVRLEEYDAPLKNNKNMSYDKIKQLLNDEHVKVSIDPAHCSKLTVSISDLPTDLEFTKLLTRFNEIDWASKYNLVKSNLKTDQRFINILSEQFPDKSKETLLEDFDNLVNELGKKQGLEGKDYMAKWLREQMTAFVAGLSGTHCVEGSRVDLEEAKKNAAVIIPYLETLSDGICLEDDFLKLAVEGGNYCALGLKRATGEFVESILQTKVFEGSGDEGTERKIRSVFQEERRWIFANAYLNLTEGPLLGWFVTTPLDQHQFDDWSKFLSLGFLPMATSERLKMDLIDLFCLEYFASHRQEMFEKYESDKYATKDRAMKVVGAIHLLTYAQKLIDENAILTEVQKKELADEINDKIVAPWDYEDFDKKVEIFVLVSLGIFRTDV